MLSIFFSMMVFRSTLEKVREAEMRLMPMPESSRICLEVLLNITLFKKSMSFVAVGLPHFHSIPA